MYPGEMVDFGKSDKMIRIMDKWINQALTMDLVVILFFITMNYIT